MCNAHWPALLAAALWTTALILRWRRRRAITSRKGNDDKYGSAKTGVEA